MRENTLPTNDEWRTTVYSGNYEVNRSGQVRNRLTQKILKPYSNGKYLKVKLACENGKIIQPFVHRLVASAFLPTDSITGLEADHINGNRHDNNLYNLRWVTRQENAQNRSNLQYMRKCEKELATV